MSSLRGQADEPHGSPKAASREGEVADRLQLILPM